MTTGITDPTEEYFKDGVWGWDTVQQKWRKVLVYASGYLHVASAGTDTYLEEIHKTVTDPVINYLYSTYVPANQVWILDSIVAMTYGYPCSDIVLAVNTGTDNYIIARKKNPAAGEIVYNRTPIHLFPGQRIEASFTLTQTGDYLYLNIVGHKFV